SIGPNWPEPVIMGNVLSGAGISISPMAIPVDPITMASGASLPTALARSFFETPIKFLMLWPIAFMV
ncbi:hypothetical protein, partial [Escherichia coli]|uniref:hypothetical protein n=1 Tax=Escherichia coli TaxID=562 RepID=UPI00203458BF